MKPKDKPHYLGHRKRLKTKFLKESKHFEDYELLEIFLFFSHPRKDVKPLAKKLLSKFGSLNTILYSDIEELKKIKELNKTTIVSFKLFHELVIRSAKQKIINKPIINNWQQLVFYCKTTMSNLKKEQFRMLFLDKQQHLITDELLKDGAIENIEIDTRKIIEKSLEYSASYAILVHNHPNNNAKPSQSDIKTTQKIIDALKPIRVKIYDHLIIGKNNELFSFKSEGLL